MEIKTNQCPGCLGAGVQRSTKDGICYLCPICNGSGIFENRKNKTFIYETQSPRKQEKIKFWKSLEDGKLYT